MGRFALEKDLVLGRNDPQGFTVQKFLEVSQAREAGFATGGTGIIFTVAEILLEGCLIHVNLCCHSIRPVWKPLMELGRV